MACRRKQKVKKGFTLIELLVVVLIIGILAAVALAQYNKAVAKSRATQLQTLLAKVVQASESYHMATGSWPVSFDDLDIQFNNLQKFGSWNAFCAKDMVANSTLKGDNFEISLYTGGIGKKYRVGAYFTTGKYQCRGFTHFLYENNETWNDRLNDKTFCAEGIYRRACGETYCDPGIFCAKIMGKKIFQKNYATVDLYSM